MASNEGKQSGKGGASAPASPGEGLLSPGLVFLFGRPFTGLAVGDLATAATLNNQLASSISAAKGNASLARIYGFSYLGSYHKLAEPAVFLVFTQGRAVAPDFFTPKVRTELAGIDREGNVITDGVQMWPSDQMDMAVRIDIQIGWLKDLLLSESAAEDERGATAGREANLVGGRSNLIGRDSNLIGRGR